MSIESKLIERSESACELCHSSSNLGVYLVSPKTEETEDNCAYICATCKDQIEHDDKTQANHWRCLNDSMWSVVPAVQVIAYRMLTRLKSEGWPVDLLEMLYLDDETLAWANEGIEEEATENIAIHKDSNGAELQAGDTVVLIKDLNVKGTSFTAKRGTAVRNISLVADNVEHIEGRVNGVQLVILTKFVKKS